MAEDLFDVHLCRKAQGVSVDLRTFYLLPSHCSYVGESGELVCPLTLFSIHIFSSLIGFLIVF